MTPELLSTAQALCFALGLFFAYNVWRMVTR